jgi:hypothetical protein
MCTSGLGFPALKRGGVVSILFQKAFLADEFFNTIPQEF